MPGYVRAHGSRLVKGGRRGFGAGATPAPPSGGDTEVSSISVEGETGTWHGYNKGSLIFAYGECPSGSAPWIKRGGVEIDAQFSRRSYWPDGSLRRCTFYIRDDDWTASRTYTYGHRIGTYTDSSAFDISTLAAAHDFKVTVANCYEYGNGPSNTWLSPGTSNPSGGNDGDRKFVYDDTSATGGAVWEKASGTWSDVTTSARSARSAANDTASFNTAVGTPANIETLCDGDICTAYRVNCAVGSDPDLRFEAFVEVYKTAAGAIHHCRVAFRSQQSGWKSTTKRLLNYDATVYDGVTSLASWTDLWHAPHGGALMIENRDSLWEGRPITVGTTEAQTWIKYDWEYWSDAGAIDPYDFGYGSVSNYTTRYLPHQPMRHRALVGGTGTYMGRGVISGSDLVHVLNNTATSLRYMRVNALAGIHINQTWLSDAKPMRIKALIMEGNSATSGDYDFTADGLEAGVHAYNDAAAATPRSAAAGRDDSWSAPADKAASHWLLELGSPHRPDFSYFAYLVEAEEYNLYATISNAMAAVHNQAGTLGFGWDDSLEFDDGNAEDFSATIWSGWTSNTRSIGWAANVLAHAAAVVPSDCPEHGHMNFLAEQNFKAIRRATDLFSAARLANGYWDDRAIDSPWQSAYCCLGIAQGWRVLRNQDAKDTVEDFWSQVPVRNWANCSPYKVDAYRPLIIKANNDVRITRLSAFPSDGELYAAENCGGNTWTVTVDATADTLQFSDTGSGALFVPPANGDKIRFSPYKGVYALCDKPGGTAWNQDYYLINVSGTSNWTFQIATTPGGSAVDLTSEPSTCAVSFFSMSVWDSYNFIDAPSTPHNSSVVTGGFYGDDYAQQQGAAVILCYELGLASVPSALCDYVRLFSSTLDLSDPLAQMWSYKRRDAA